MRVRDDAATSPSKRSRSRPWRPNLYLVFSKRPEAISAEDYDRWYEAHAQENIESPEFLSARRFNVSSQRERGPVPASRAVRVRGRRRSAGDALNERIESRDVKLPEWFPQIQFGAGTANPVSGLLTPSTAGRLMDALERLVAIQDDPRPDRALRDLLRRQGLEGFADLWAEDASWAGPGMSFEGKPALMEFLDVPARRLQRQAHELAAAGRDHRRHARAARTDVVWITDGLREPHRRALRRHLPARRRPLAVREAHRDRRAVRKGEPPMSDTAMELEQPEHCAPAPAPAA